MCSGRGILWLLLFYLQYLKGQFIVNKKVNILIDLNVSERLWLTYDMGGSLRTIIYFQF